MSIAQLELIETDVTTLESISITLESCRLRLEHLKETDTISQEGMCVGMEMISGVVGLLPLENPMPSLEDVNDDPVAAFTVSMESLANLGRRIWEAIKAAIRKLIDFIIRAFGLSSSRYEEIRLEARNAKLASDDEIEARVKGKGLKFPELVRYAEKGYAKDLQGEFRRLELLANVYLDVLDSDVKVRKSQVKALQKAVRSVKSNPKDNNVRKQVKTILKELARHTDEQLERQRTYRDVLSGGGFLGGFYVHQPPSDDRIQPPQQFKTDSDMGTDIIRYASGNLPKLNQSQFDAIIQSIDSIMKMTSKFSDTTFERQKTLSDEIVAAMDEFLKAVKDAGGVKDTYSEQMRNARFASTQALRNSLVLDRHCRKVADSFLMAYSKQ